MSGCIVALDHFSTTDHTFCSDLNTLEDGPLASACTLIVASPSVFRDDERTDQAQVEIDPLDAVSAALIVSDVTGASSEVALRFAESLEAHMRSPRDLIRVLRNAEVAATVSDEESTAAKEAFRSAYRERFRSAITATPDAERAALVDAVWSYLTDATAAERHRTPADITPILGRAIPGNAKEAIYLSGEDLYETLDDDMLKHRLNDSDFKANLDKLLSTIDRARSTDSASAEPAPANLATIDELIDEVALASRTSTLGPIIVTPPRFASAEGDQTLSRALSRIRSIRNEVRRLDELSDCAVPAKIDLSAYALELVANELCYTDLVHDFPRQVDAYRRRVIDRATRGPAVADTDTAWRIRLDSCESAISRGSVDDVAATWIRELSERSTDRPSSVAGQLQIRAKIHRLIVDGDAEQLGGVWHEVQRVVADMTAVSTPDNEIADLVAKFISASAALDSRSPTLRASVKQFQETMFGDDDDSSSISKYCLSTRAVSITAATLDAHEEKELLEPFLKRAIKHMASVLETLRELAIAGDNRPVLTSARQRRRLSRLLFDRGLMEQARLERDAAISELRWVVDNCPTPAAWLTLLRCVDTEERFALEDTLQLASLRTNDSMNRFAPLRKQYRKWAQSIAGVNMRLVEIEYMLLESTWSREGSILQIANHSDRRWMSRPIDQKLKKLTHLHEQRVLSLDRLQRRFGHSHFSTVMRASVEAQYQTSVALIKRSDFDPLPVDAILNKGLTADPQSLRLKFERARHLRSRRQFAEARMQLDASETNLSIADPLLARAWRVLYADVLLQLAAVAEPDERIRLATEAVGIVDQYADGDIRAAMILGRAHAEAGYAPRVSMISVVQLLVQANEFAEFVDNFRDRVTEFDSLALRVGDKATAQLVTDVTNPEALFGYALVLIRHFIRSDRSEATLNFLKAAMLCLDGARVMTSGRAMTPVVNFLIGLSAIMACRIGRSPITGPVSSRASS